MMHLQEAGRKKRNTLQIYATLDKYDSYRRSCANLPKLYENDLLFYNDTVEQRHQRNKKQIRKIVQVLKHRKITPDMLQFNTTNTFYPSYVLNHHYEQFIKMTAGLAQNNSTLKSLLPNLQNFSTIGAVFDRMINVEFKKQTHVAIQNGVVKMSPNSYFYSFKTSPYINVCCFQVKQNEKYLYVYVQVRDNNNQFCKGVQVRDLGATLSPDYLAVAYRFDGVKPLAIAETHSARFYRNALSDDSTTQLGYSLQDLAHSLYITVKYTNMRLQFATLEDSKKQRPIGQYQAVTSRIADGFATLYGLSFLRQRLINMPQVASIMRFYLPFMHQIILERLIDLRQCCGGYGYLQMSGHPGFLERVSLRSSQPALTTVPQNPQIMKRVHYYTSDDNLQKQYTITLSEKGDKMSDIFSYFFIICIKMKQNRDKMTDRQYMKQFLRQSCIQTYYSSTYFDPIDPTNPSQNLLPFIIVKYVIQHSKFLNWDNLKYNRQQFNEMLINTKRQYLLKIAFDIPKLLETLEIGTLRNVIVGEENADQFYKKVMEASQKNKRNSPEYKQDILSNLKALIKKQRASL